MADGNLDLKLKLTADDQASAEISALRAEIARLSADMAALKAKNEAMNESKPGFWASALDWILKLTTEIARLIADLAALKAKNEAMNESKPGFWASALDWILKLTTSLSVATIALADFGKMSDEEFLKYAEAQIKTAQATGRAVDASIQQEAANRKISASYDELVRKITTGNESFDALLHEIKGAAQAHDALRVTQQTGMEATRAFNAALLAQSEVFGGTRAAIDATLERQQQAIEDARQDAAIKRQIADEELANLAALSAKRSEIDAKRADKQLQFIIEQALAKIGLAQIKDETEATKELSAEQLQQLETLRQSAIQKSDAAKIAESHVKQLEAEAHSSKAVVDQITALTNAAQQNANLQINEVEVEKKLIEAKKEEAISRLKVTQSQEDENAVAEFAQQLAQKEIELADQQADKARIAADAAREYATQIKKRVENTENATEADRHESVVAEQYARILEKAALAALRNAQAKRNAAASTEEVSKQELAAAAKSVAATEAQEKALDKKNEIAIKTNEIQLKLALGEGRYADAVLLAMEREKLQIAAAQDRATQIQKEIESQKNLIDKLEHSATVVEGRLIPADEAIIAAAKEKLLTMEAELQKTQLTINKTEEIAGARQREIVLSREVAEAARKLAISRGNENDAARESSIIAAQNLADSQRILEGKRAELQAAQQLLAKKIEENAGRIMAVEEYNREIGASKAVVSQKTLEMQQAEKDVELKQREAQQAEILAGAIGQLERMYEKQALEHQRAGEASTRYNELQVREAEGALRLAEISGDSNEVARAQTELGDRRLDQAEALSKAAAVEAADAESSLSLKTAELAADGELSEADQNLLDGLENTVKVKRDAAQSAQQNVDQMRKESDAAKDAARGIDIVTSAKQRNDRVTREQIESDKAFHANAAAGADLITRILNGWSMRLEALSPVSRRMFDSFIYGSQASTKYLSEMDLKMKEIEDKQRVAYRGMADYGFVRWANTVATKALEIEKSFWAQADAADSLVKKLNGVGTSANSLQQLADQAENAKRDFNQLDNTRLDQLAHAIENARNRVDELREATLTAQQRLVQLDEELAREQGDNERADLLRQQIDYEQQLAEIQRNLQQAETAHNQELIQLYQQQMARLNELNNLRIRNIENENKKPKPKPGASDADPSTNQQESDRQQIAQQNQTTDALAAGAARRNQVLTAMAQAAREAAAANATASQSIIQSNRALASALAEEGDRATQNIQTISSELAAAVEQQQAESGAALAQLEQDNNAAIVAANQNKANALAAAEADNAKKINDIHQDALAERVKLDEDYQKGQQDIAARLDSNILQINQNTARGITDVYARSREEIGKIQQTFADRVQALNDQFSAQSLQAGSSLAQRAEALRRQLLSQTGEQGQAVNAEFGDQIAELARMYASAGAGAQDNFNAAIERARQLNAIQLQGLLDSGKITQEQYAAAQAEAARVAASAAAQAEQERARLEAERAAKKAALEAERDQQIAAAQAVADAKKVALVVEAQIKKEQLLAEITAAQAALEEETAARRAAIDADEASRLEAQNTAHADALAKIDAGLAAKLAALADEYAKSQQAAADALAQKLADIQAEADARAAQIESESAARRAQLQAEHDQAIKNIQDEHAARLQAIQAQAAEAAKPPPKPAEPEPKPAGSAAKPTSPGVGGIGGSQQPSPTTASPVFTLNIVMGQKTLTATTTQNPSEFLSALERSKSLSVSP